MVISEKQIAQLITIVNDFSVILAQSDALFAKNNYDKIRDLLDDIANQQSEELKVIE